MERCKIHPEDLVQRMCERCGHEAVCSACIKELHQGHTVVKHEDVTCKIKRMKQENKIVKERLETDLTRLLNSRRYLQRASREMKRQLEERKKFLKKKLDQIKKQMLEYEDSVRSQKEKSVMTLERQIKESITRRTKFDGELQRILSLEGTTEFTKAYLALRPPEDKGYMIPETISRCFVPGPLEDPTLLEIFGEMYDTDHQYEAVRPLSIRNNSSSSSLKTLSKDFSNSVSSHENKEINFRVTASKDSSSSYHESNGAYAEVTPSGNSSVLYQRNSADSGLDHQNDYGHVKSNFKEEQFEKHNTPGENKEMNIRVTASKDGSSASLGSDGAYAEATPSRSSSLFVKSKSADSGSSYRNKHGHVTLKFKEEQSDNGNTPHDKKEMNARVTASKDSPFIHQGNDDSYAEVTPSGSGSVFLQSKNVESDPIHRNKENNVKPQFKDEQFRKNNTLFIARSDVPDHNWVKRSNVKEVNLEDKMAKIKYTITFSQNIHGISTLAGNKLLVCIPECACIRLVDIYSALDFVGTAPLYPRAVCSGRFGGVFAILCDCSDVCSPTGSSVLVKYKQNGNKGQEELRTNKDKFGKDLFLDPRKISVNNTGKRVVVINATSKTCSHLLLFSGKLQLLWRYFGDGKTYSGDEEIDESVSHIETDMCIFDAVFDTNDNIIIADQQSNSIRILDKNLNRFCVISTYSNNPCALALVDNKVWIWFDNGNTSIESYTGPTFK